MRAAKEVDADKAMKKRTFFSSISAVASEFENITDAWGVIDAVKRNAVDPVETTSVHNIDRWWCMVALEFLCKLRSGIEAGSEKRLLEDVSDITSC